MKTLSKSICALLLISFTPSARPLSQVVSQENVIKQRLSEKPPKAYRHRAHELSMVIVSESLRYRLDPYLVTAVIAGESSYNPLARGAHGEIGLMQLKPKTARWIVQKRRLRLPRSWRLQDPSINVSIGAAYLSHLKEQFSWAGGTLFLSAFNMGPSKLLKKLALHVKPQVYHNHIMRNYLTVN